jgi:hypothetical protein
MTVITNIPLGYSYINFCLGGLISETGWDNLTYIFIAEEVWRLMDITAEPTDTTEIFKYYALLKYKALDQFRRELSTAYDFSDQGVSKHRSQMFKQVSEMLVEAKQEALPYLPLGQIEVGSFSYPDDPYSIGGQVEHNA